MTSLFQHACSATLAVVPLGIKPPLSPELPAQATSKIMGLFMQRRWCNGPRNEKRRLRRLLIILHIRICQFFNDTTAMPTPE